MNSSGVTAVSPGATRTCSQPASTKTGHNKSTARGAATSNPRDVPGARRLEASPTATCPMNIASPP